MSPSSRYSLGVLHGHRALVLGGVEEADVGVLTHWDERWRDGGRRGPLWGRQPRGDPKPRSSPEILIFFTVLLVLLVTWTLTLMGSPW